MCFSIFPPAVRTATSCLCTYQKENRFGNSIKCLSSFISTLLKSWTVAATNSSIFIKFLFSYSLHDLLHITVTIIHIIMGVGGAKVFFGRGLLEYKQLCDWRIPNRIMGNVVSFHTIIKK